MITILGCERVPFGAGATPAPETIDVPPGCTAVYVVWEAWTNGTDHGVSSLLLDGDPPDFDDGDYTIPANNTTDWAGAFCFKDPPIGEVDLEIEVENAPEGGPVAFVLFVAGDDGLGFKDIARSGEIEDNPADDSVDSAEGDLIVAFNWCYAPGGSGDEPVADAGYTEQAQGYQLDSAAILATKIAGAGATSSYTTDGTGTYNGLQLFSIGQSPVSIDTVGMSANEIRVGDVDIPIAGEGFLAAQGGGAVSITQGAVTKPQPTIGAWSDTDIEFDLDFDSSTEHLKFGPATLRVTNDDADYGEAAIVIEPLAGQLYVNVVSPGAGAGYIETDPAAATGDQVWISGEGSEGADPAPSGLTVGADLHAEFAPGHTPVPFDACLWDQTTKSWGAWATVGVGGVELIVAGASHGHAATSPTLTQANQLAVQDASHGHAATSPTLTQANQLAVQDASHGHAATSPTLTQSVQLTVQDASHGHAATSPTLTQANQLAVQNAAHAHQAGSPALTQAHQLAVQGAAHAHTAGSPALTQANQLAVQNADHAHTAGSPALTQANQLAVQNADHAHVATAPALTQAHQLAVLNALHDHLAGSPELLPGDVLAVASALHAHLAGSPSLTQAHVLVALNALHAHVAGSPALTQQHQLAVQSAHHDHAAGSPDLSASELLQVLSALHAHVAGSPVLTQQNLLAVLNAFHGHQASSPALTQANQLAVNSALHAHLATTVALILELARLARDALSTVPPEDRVSLLPPDNEPRLFVVPPTSTLQ
jgi:hypothetical protein